MDSTISVINDALGSEANVPRDDVCAQYVYTAPSAQSVIWSAGSKEASATVKLISGCRVTHRRIDGDVAVSRRRGVGR